MNKIITDIEKIKNDETIVVSLQSFTDIQKGIETLKVIDVDTKSDALNKLDQIKKVTANLEATRKDYTAPLFSLQKSIKAEFDNPINSLNSLKPLINQKVIAYDNKMEELARKERAKIEEQNRKKLEKHNAKIEEGKSAPVPILKDTEIKHEIKTQVDSGKTMSQRTTYFAEVENESLIPREYMIVDMKKLNAAAKNNIPVPGMKRASTTQYV